MRFKPKLKLMHKFLITYLLLIMVPLTILFTYTYSKMSQMIENNVTQSTQQAFEQTHSFLSYRLFRIFDISNILSIDKNITSILLKDPSSYSLVDQIKDQTFLRSTLSSYENNVDVANVSLYLNDKFIYSGENVNLYSIKQADNSKWLSMIKDYNSRYVWCPSPYLEDTYKPSNKLLALTKSIKNPDNLSEDIGYLRINFDKSTVEDIINKINSFEGGYSYIENSKGTIVASTSYDNLSKSRINSDIVKELSESTKEFKLTKKNIDGKTVLISCALIPKTDWYLVSILPYSSLLSKINSQRLYLIVIVIVFGGIALALSFYFAKSISKRISMVVEGMRGVHVDNLDEFIENDSEDELGDLINNYNYMIMKMSVLIDEQYKLGKEVKNSELKALQAQINPHFLYNTLDMINWMSYKNMNSEISKAVKSLAKFYKLSLSKGKALISIEDELSHSTLYVQLQNMRYNNRITLNINVDEAIYFCLIPKITLQPILENSILHGILGKGNESGTILITGYIEGDNILLKVSDDGIGMKETELSSVLSSEHTSSIGSGYGLMNIDQRLKLSYGEIYGLTFESIYGYGTTVIIKIPLIKE